MISKFYGDIQDRLEKIESVINEGIAEGEQMEGDVCLLHYLYELKNYIEGLK